MSGINIFSSGYADCLPADNVAPVLENGSRKGVKKLIPRSLTGKVLAGAACAAVAVAPTTYQVVHNSNDTVLKPLVAEDGSFYSRKSTRLGFMRELPFCREPLVKGEFAAYNANLQAMNPFYRDVLSMQNEVQKQIDALDKSQVSPEHRQEQQRKLFDSMMSLDRYAAPVEFGISVNGRVVSVWKNPEGKNAYGPNDAGYHAERGLKILDPVIFGVDFTNRAYRFSGASFSTHNPTFINAYLSTLTFEGGSHNVKTTAIFQHPVTGARRTVVRKDSFFVDDDYNKFLKMKEQKGPRNSAILHSLDLKERDYGPNGETPFDREKRLKRSTPSSPKRASNNKGRILARKMPSPRAFRMKRA